jgi:hypothetical protein
MYGCGVGTGVKWSRKTGKWAARVKVRGKKVFLGHYVDDEEAARAYDRAARCHHGPRAKLNFPPRTRRHQPAEGEEGFVRYIHQTDLRGGPGEQGG